MNKKTFFYAGVLVAIIITLLIFYVGQKESQMPNDESSSALIIGKNSIYASDQIPGDTVLLAIIRLEKPGFAVIHEDEDGKPGQVLGASNLLSKGETKNLPPIKLSRPTKDGHIIYAMLHLDNGDNTFNIGTDKPAIDPVGKEPVMTIVNISQDSTYPGEVSL